MNRYSLSIAGLNLQIETEQCLVKQEKFLPFFKETQSPDFRIYFRQVEQLPVIPDQVLYEDESYHIHPDGMGGYIRSFFDTPQDVTPYAVAVYDYAQGIIQVDYLEKGAHCVSELHNSFFHLNFEELLLRRKRLCFHAACVQTALGGLLFSGASGIGKSTQAKLWCEHRGAQQINGDRPILSKGQNGWLAWGSPYAGSSRCYMNKNCQMTAIVMLQQTKTCSLRRLRPAEAFRAVWSGLTIHSWDGSFTAAASDLTLALIEEIPVFEFGCTPDVQAVEFLENALRKECDL